MEKFDLHRFDGKDFFLWKYQMRLFLLGQELWEVVDGVEECPVAADPAIPTAAETAAIKAWKKLENKSMMYLTQALSKGQLSKVVNCNSSKDIWNRLCAIHEQKDESSIHLVQQQFFDYRMDKASDIATHISKVESLARRLKDLGEEQTDTAIITKILWTLPPSYRGFISSWDSTPAAERTLQNLTSRLLKEEEMDKKHASLNQEEKAEIFVAQGQRKHFTGSNKGKFKGECRHCKRKGHKEVDCWSKHPEKRPQRGGSANVTESESGKSALIMMAAISETVSEGWVADSGATDHMCSVRE